VPYKERVGLLRVLIASHPVLRGSAKSAAIADEINRIATAGRFARRSRWLLSVLHTTRTMDTTLSEVLVLKGWSARGKSLGSYLRELEKKRILTNSQVQQYQLSVVDKRNTYMHQAGAAPSKLEADTILAEMHACVSHVLGQLLRRLKRQV
jgi:hypothetical protein